MIDVEVARTFLKVAETGSFQVAAKELNVTQSTVSARIRTLETRLGQKVFDRNRLGTRLNAHGEAFRRYALTIVHAWEEGRRVAGSRLEPSNRLRIGGEHDLWTRLLPLWLLELRAAFPETTISAVAADSDTLARCVAAGNLDLAVMHRTPAQGAFEIEPLMDDELILVTTDPQGGFEDRYVDIRWRSEAAPAIGLPSRMVAKTRTSVDLGFASINYLMMAQAAGYLPRRLVGPYVDAGYLYATAGAPTIRNPVYLLTRGGAAADEMTRKAIAALRDLAAVASRGELPPPFWSQMF